MLEKAYSPEAVEKRWVDAWAQARLFKSEPAPGRKAPYTIVIPPPNVTGALHIGHALNNTLQDVLVRWQRLHGREACWVPGTDHGGIATQNVMEKQLKGEGTSRQALGRERFLERMQAWTRDCKRTILGQLTRLGCALDFSREAFTMDEPRARAVHHAFGRFYDEGLVFRGERMVNWCVRCGTALSDIEVEYEDRKGSLWHIRYPLADDPKRFLTVATTRPETMLGDTAVAVHPSDERYRGLVGKKLRLPLQGRLIPIVADEHVDPAFGSGAVKITPRHDPNDFEVWQRHLSELEDPPQAIGLDGKMTEAVAAPYAGLSREEARRKVVEDLKAELGADGEPLLAKTEDHRHAVGVCYRCQSAIEPMLSEQWFMRMGPLAEKALAALDQERFTLNPASWAKPYREWLAGIRDWCLSRQIWWGHRIPVWYCADCLGGKLIGSAPDGKGGAAAGTVQSLSGEGIPFETIAREGSWRYVSGGKTDAEGLKVQPGRPRPCASCGNDRWLQDQDVLDTWFSSALWPLSVFGWPEETEDLKYYYPTSVLVTGYEILYLWVARMQMMGLHFLGEVPFGQAVIHGIVRDKRGKKMSKSLGNVVDPLVMMDKFGTDALRFALCSQAHPGKDIPFAEDSLVGPRNFVNKLWNSTRFVLMNLPEAAPKGGWRLENLDAAALDTADRWILAEYQETLKRARALMAEEHFAAAADVLYGFLWDKYCDWYIELAKPRLSGEGAAAPRAILVQVLVGTLKLLHPFMPYVTEELYAALKEHAGESAEFLLKASAPALSRDWSDPEAVGRMGFVMEAVGALRALRAQLNVPPALEIEAFYEGNGQDAGRLAEHDAYVRRLARLKGLAPAGGKRPPQSATAVAGRLTLYLPLAGLIDLKKEKARLAKELAALAAEAERCEKQLSNPSFVDRAPEEEVEKIRRRLEDAKAKREGLAGTLKSLEAD